MRSQAIAAALRLAIGLTLVFAFTATLATASSAGTDRPPDPARLRDQLPPPPAFPDHPHRCPRTDGEGLETSRLLGKTMRRARMIAARHDCTVRVIRRNGKPLVVTDDFRHDRINVSIVDRRISRVHATY
jgi:hypothetical protein